jgi:broad specificity phosphatase PhoE
MAFRKVIASSIFGTIGGTCAVFGALSTDKGIEFVSKKLNAHNINVYLSGKERPKRIILVRHGQGHGYAHTSGTNESGKPHCSELEPMRRPLTSEGRKQSLAAGVYLKQLLHQESVRFYVSPFLTTRQSFEFLGGSFDQIKCQFVDEPRLRNQDFGDHPPERELELRELAKKNPFYYRFPGGESGADVYDRLSAFLESMHREWQLPSRADNYVLVTHNVICQMFLCRWFHWSPATFKALPRWPGGGVLVMEQNENGKYVITESPFTKKQISTFPLRARKCFEMVEDELGGGDVKPTTKTS